MSAPSNIFADSLLAWFDVHGRHHLPLAGFNYADDRVRPHCDLRQSSYVDPPFAAV
jgi:hypothetical protein